jgi:hypothetical protein
VPKTRDADRASAKAIACLTLLTMALVLAVLFDLVR